MVETGVRIEAFCPSCKEKVIAEGRRDDAGILHAMPLSTEQLIAHAHCDLWSLMAEIAKSAFHQSKVTTFQIRGEG